MKARKLKQIMNGIDYCYHYDGGKICIGSAMCSDLISVDINTLKVKYALDTFNDGRASLKDKKLMFIWDKLHELIASDEIRDIVIGKDTIENPLPVFTVKGGELIESATEEYGWPNVDDNGILMYENTHFPTKEQAIEYGIKKYETKIEWLKDDISFREKCIEEKRGYIQEAQSFINHLKRIRYEQTN